jgi:hypothetical protein
VTDHDAVRAADIDAIRAREAAATKGPWAAAHKAVIAVSDGTYVVSTYDQATAEFIAAARTDIPALLAANAALAERLTYLESAWKTIQPQGLCFDTDCPCTAHTAVPVAPEIEEQS